MMSMERAFQFRLMFTAVLADIFISFKDFNSYSFPVRASIIRNTTPPTRVFIASIFSTLEFIPAFLRTEVIFAFKIYLAFCQSNWFTTVTTACDGYIRIVGRIVFTLIYFLKVNSIASKGTSLSDFGLSAISNKFFTTDFTYQFSHTDIISEYGAYNKAPEYRTWRG